MLSTHNVKLAARQSDEIPDNDTVGNVNQH